MVFVLCGLVYFFLYANDLWPPQTELTLHHSVTLAQW